MLQIMVVEFPGGNNPPNCRITEGDAGHDFSVGGKDVNGSSFASSNPSSFREKNSVFFFLGGYISRFKRCV